MLWENLTAPDFAKAVKDTGVCIITMGVLERHGDHLPLGTDFLTGQAIATLAAEKEPAVVFPDFYFGQIYEARCYPGTITLPPTLLVELLQNVFNEIARNGFRKIIVFNAHGGNRYLLHFLAQADLSERKNYSLYLYQGLSEEERKQMLSLYETELSGHAGEGETSLSLAVHPHLVKMEEIPAEPVLPLGRTDHLQDAFAGIKWYSNYPLHYSGDAKPATVEKGQAMLEIQVKSLARFIKKVKEDRVVPELNKEFYDKVDKL
ncbi:MAG TPA: creatininase family protein [Firmicutes bacterium]|nr:creatininase family protein [Bacillota bacterium]